MSLGQQMDFRLICDVMFSNYRVSSAGGAFVLP